VRKKTGLPVAPISAVESANHEVTDALRLWRTFDQPIEKTRSAAGLDIQIAQVFIALQ
jgi:hypothetical protein